MGICSSSSQVGYEELRNSIPGSMLADQQDFDLFYSLCKVETVGSISTAVHPSPTQLFYVVVSGQVVIHLSSPTVANMCGTTFSKGDMIHFFNCPLQPVTKLDHTCLRNGGIKLSIQFKGYTEKMGRVIGMDRKGWETFVSTRYEKKKKLQSLLNLDMTNFISSSNYFYTLTPQQVHILGPMLKIRLAEKGGLMCFPSRQNVGVAKNYTSAGTVGILLTGSCLSVPAGESIDHIVDKLRKETPKSKSESTTRGHVNSLSPRQRKPGLGSTISRLFSNSDRRVSQQQPHLSSTSLRSVVSIPISVSDSTQKGRSSLSVQSGAIMGLDKFFMRSPDIAMRKYLATSSSCIVGYITPKILDSLCEIDPRFLRVIARNYYGVILSWLRPSVPLLNGMDDASFAKLNSKVYLKGFTTGSIIYERDTPSDTAYIVLHGSVSSAVMVKEQVEDDPALTQVLTQSNQSPPVGGGNSYHNHSAASHSTHLSQHSSHHNSQRSLHSLSQPPHTHEQELEQEQILTWGAMFGDVALVTNRNYFTTTTARDPVMTLAISKKTIEDIYFENKAKLCEIRIRLVGAEVDLLHVIDHPYGSEQFMHYLTHMMATENLLFYHAVDRFESMCLAVLKLFEETKRIRAKLDKNITTVAELRQSEKNIPALKTELTSRIDGSFAPTVTASDSLAAAPRGASAEGAMSVSSDSTARPGHSQHLVQSPGAATNVDAVSMARMLAEFDQQMPVNLPVLPHPDMYTSGDDTDRDRESRGPYNKQYSVNTEVYDALGAHAGALTDVGSVDGANVGSDHDADVLEGLPTFQFQAGPHQTSRTALSAATQPAGVNTTLTADHKPSSSSPFDSPNEENGRKRLKKKSVLRDKLFVTTPHSAKTQNERNAEISVALAETHGVAPESNRLYDAHAAAVIEQINQILFGKIQRKIGKMQDSMVELKEVARSMMETFIYEKAPSQVNISSTTRKEMERRFQEWDTGASVDVSRSNSLTSLRAQALQKAHTAAMPASGDPFGVANGALRRQNSADGTPREGKETPLAGSSSAAVPAHYFLHIDYTGLFDEAKSEVLRIMRLDSFQRWKRTPEFTAFINNFQHIDSLELPNDLHVESYENSCNQSVDETALVGVKKIPAGMSGKHAQATAAPVAPPGASSGVSGLLSAFSSIISTPNPRASSSVTPVKPGVASQNAEEDSFLNS